MAKLFENITYKNKNETDSIRAIFYCVEKHKSKKNNAFDSAARANEFIAWHASLISNENSAYLQFESQISMSIYFFLHQLVLRARRLKASFHAVFFTLRARLRVARARTRFCARARLRALAQENVARSSF